MLSQQVGMKDSPLYPLVYPVVQVMLGTIKLDPSSQYFPLRFYLTESLLRLLAQTGVHIEFVPTLLEPLESSLMTTTHPKKSEKEVRPVDFNVTLRVHSSYLSGSEARIYRDQVAAKLVSSLTNYFDRYAFNPAFPEVATSCISVIKEWIQKNGENCGSKARRALGGLADKLEENVRWVEEKRKGMEFSIGNPEKNQVLADAEEAPLREWMKTQSS